MAVKLVKWSEEELLLGGGSKLLAPHYECCMKWIYKLQLAPSSLAIIKESTATERKFCYWIMFNLLAYLLEIVKQLDNLTKHIFHIQLLHISKMLWSMPRTDKFSDAEGIITSITLISVCFYYAARFCLHIAGQCTYAQNHFLLHSNADTLGKQQCNFISAWTVIPQQELACRRGV